MLSCSQAIDQDINVTSIFDPGGKIPSHCTDLLFLVATVRWREAPGIKYSNWVGIGPVSIYLKIIFRRQFLWGVEYLLIPSKPMCMEALGIPRRADPLLLPGYKSHLQLMPTQICPDIAMPTSFQSSITHWGLTPSLSDHTRHGANAQRGILFIRHCVIWLI